MPHPRHRTTAARRLLVGTALAVAALALAACGDDGGAAVSVSGAWARATVAGQSNGAAYLTLRGTGTAVPCSGRPTVPTFCAPGRLAVSAAVVSVRP